MANLNKVLLIGRLTRDPQLRYTPGGKPVTDVGIAINRTWTGADGQRNEETTFVEVTLWARQAELAAKYLNKGRSVFIEGRLKLDQWDTPDGQHRSKLRVVAENMQFIGPRSGTAGEPQEMGMDPSAGGDELESRSGRTSPVEPVDDEVPF